MEFESIQAVRNEIDALDKQLVTLIAKRCECVRAAAAFKKDSDAVRAPDRVQQVIDKVRRQAQQEGLPEEVIEQIYRAMIEAFIALELKQHQTLQQ